MIKINLLTQDMMQGAGGGPSAPSSGTTLVTGVLLAVFLLNAAIGGAMYYYVSTAQAERNVVSAEAAELREELEEMEIVYDERRLDLQRMEELIEVAESLDPPDRLLWSRKLNMLPLIVPEGVFLTEIRVTRRVTEVQTQRSLERQRAFEQRRGQRGAPTQPPPIERAPVYRQTLVMDGVAYVAGGSDTQRLQQISLFAANIRDRRVALPFDDEESAERFIDGFSPNIEPAPATASQIEGREVLVFSFTMETLPLRIE